MEYWRRTYKTFRIRYCVSYDTAVMVVTIVAFAGTALLTRTTMMEVLKEDYILTARAKGIM